MRNALKVLWGVLLVALIVGCTVVDPTERAVKVSWGQIQGGILSPGLYWVGIGDSYPKFSLLPIEVDYNMAVGQDGGITRDNQTIGAGVKGFYKYKEPELLAVYKEYSEAKVQSLFISAMKQAIKAIIGQYTIFDIAANQDKIRVQALDELRSSTGGMPIEVTDLRITNWDWSDAFDHQIAATMETAQKAKNAEQELIVVTTNAKKGVAQAEADKQQAIIQAEGALAAAKLQADAKTAEGEGIRRYNQSIAQNLEVQLKLKALEIEAARVDKWDGHYVSQNNYGPIPVQTGSIQGK